MNKGSNVTTSLIHPPIIFEEQSSWNRVPVYSLNTKGGFEMIRRRNEWQTAVQPNGKAVYIKMPSIEPMRDEAADMYNMIQKLKNAKNHNGSKSHFKRKHTIGIIA